MGKSAGVFVQDDSQTSDEEEVFGELNNTYKSVSELKRYFDSSRNRRTDDHIQQRKSREERYDNTYSDISDIHSSFGERNMQRYQDARHESMLRYRENPEVEDARYRSLYEDEIMRQENMGEYRDTGTQSDEGDEDYMMVRYQCGENDVNRNVHIHHSHHHHQHHHQQQQHHNNSNTMSSSTHLIDIDITVYYPETLGHQHTSDVHAEVRNRTTQTNDVEMVDEESEAMICDKGTEVKSTQTEPWMWNYKQ